MKLINTSTDTVTLAMSREEFHLIRDCAWETIQDLEQRVAKRKELAHQLEGVDAETAYGLLYETELPEDSPDELPKALRRDEALLQQVKHLREALERIAAEGDLARLL
jgi:hypothetical protein